MTENFAAVEAEVATPGLIESPILTDGDEEALLPESMPSNERDLRIEDYEDSQPETPAESSPLGSVKEGHVALTETSAVKKKKARKAIKRPKTVITSEERKDESESQD